MKFGGKPYFLEEIAAQQNLVASSLLDDVAASHSHTAPSKPKSKVDTKKVKSRRRMAKLSRRKNR